MSAIFTDTLSRYYLVDFDTYVKVDRAGDDVIAINHLGNPYPVFKAIESGKEVSESEYLGAVGASKKKRLNT